MKSGKIYARRWRTIIAALLTALLLTSTTGCATRYVLVDATEKITVSKQTIDNLYNDNERLLEALQKCQAGE